MKAKPVTLTVTKEHYNKAMAAAARHSCITTTCVMAQALKAKFPKNARSVSCAWRTGTVGKQDYEFDQNGLNITTLFGDTGDRPRILEMLPLKVVITPVKYE